MAKAQSTSGVVWFAAQDWWYHNQAHSDFQLMKQVACTRPVLVVNSLGLRVPRRGVSTNPVRRILRKLRSMGKLLRAPLPELPNFWVVTPVLLPFYGNSRLARWNAAFIRAQVQFAARRAGIPKRPAIGVTIPTAWPVVQPMDRSALLFNRSDLHSAFPEADGAWVSELEDQLLRHSDAVLYVSHELMHKDAEIVADRSHFLDHGVDLDHFTTEGAIDPEIAAIPVPRVGFFGGLDDYVVDLNLLVATAQALPDVNLVLIGDATCDMEPLTSLPNVHWLGYQPYQRIPSLGRGFDVALMPWLDNEWIRFANPIKLKEYLALGLPVVSTEYPEVETYREQVRVAKDAAEFPEFVRQTLLDPGDPESRAAFVREFSWQSRAADLLSLADQIGHR